VTSRRDLARTAAAAALRLRRDGSRVLERAVCPFSFADELKLSVRFVAAPSLEGLYAPNESTIIVGSLRPRARRSFTCAHELGHHVFRHGFRIDEVDAREHDDAEFIANRFASALLMPKLAVDSAFFQRGKSALTCDPTSVYIVAGYLGVGYSTLLGHLAYTLQTITKQRARELDVPPERVRKAILGSTPPRGLVVVDQHWLGRAVDVEVDDFVILPKGTLLDGQAIRLLGPHSIGVLAQAVRRGTTTARAGSWSGTLRVSEQRYVGLAEYRHLGDEDDE
jgi:hypothetical protein